MLGVDARCKDSGDFLVLNVVDERVPFQIGRRNDVIGEKEGSMSTKDEMLQFIVTYLEYMPGDENIELSK